MTKEETKELLTLIFTAYPNFEITKDRIDLWVDMLTDAVFDKAKANTEQHIKTSKYPPTIAEIRGKPQAIVNYARAGDDW